MSRRRLSLSADRNTRVDVANIKLSRPTQREGKWQGLVGLRERLAAEGSLIDETLRDMEGDSDFQQTALRLKEVGAARMTLDEKKQRRRALDEIGVPEFAPFSADAAGAAATTARGATRILQLNVGLYCNQACAHCHVESSPKRKEAMSAEVAERCLSILAASPSIHTLDITGGAPEMNPEFERLVRGARAVRPDVEIIDRCNLTVLVEPDHADLADFLASQRVRVVASLPCYSAKNVNQQRGRGVFARSIEGLRKLNEVGYAVEGSGLSLDLVYNPLGAFLPPPQAALQDKYRQELQDEFGVSFNSLFTMTNMPIKRFADFLHRRGELMEYMDLLVRNFNPATMDSLMCRDTVSVSWDGLVYDCDFNQQLGLGLSRACGGGAPGVAATPKISVFDMDATADLADVTINFDNHCFGCTAGAGSS